MRLSWCCFGPGPPFGEASTPGHWCGCHHFLWRCGQGQLACSPSERTCELTFVCLHLELIAGLAGASMRVEVDLAAQLLFPEGEVRAFLLTNFPFSMQTVMLRKVNQKGSEHSHQAAKKAFPWTAFPGLTDDNSPRKWLLLKCHQEWQWGLWGGY